MRRGWKVALLNERLSAIPGVRVVRSGGNHDITYEDLFADLDVTGRGRLDLYNLTLSSYDHGSGLDLLHVGGLAPRIAGCDHQGTWRMSDNQRVRTEYKSNAIDIGPSGHFAGDLSGGIKGVEDAVRRFDELRRFVASWPVCPRSEYRKTSEGWFRYCVEHVASEESPWDGSTWPSQAPDGSVLTDGPCTDSPKPR